MPQEGAEQKSVAVNADLMSPINYQEIRIEEEGENLEESAAMQSPPNKASTGDRKEEWILQNNN